jgi:hypothetical protein
VRRRLALAVARFPERVVIAFSLVRVLHESDATIVSTERRRPERDITLPERVSTVVVMVAMLALAISRTPERV